jgi:hypothetical protein
MKSFCFSMLLLQYWMGWMYQCCRQPSQPIDGSESECLQSVKSESDGKSTDFFNKKENPVRLDITAWQYADAQMQCCPVLHGSGPASSSLPARLPSACSLRCDLKTTSLRSQDQVDGIACRSCTRRS